MARRSVGFVDVSELEAGLKQLERVTREAVALSATKKAAAILAESVSNNAPSFKGSYRYKRRTPGDLKKSIKVREFKETPGRRAHLVFTPDPIAHLIEFGHRLVRGGRKRTGKGRVIGQVSAKPGSLGYFRKAIVDRSPDMFDAMADRIEAEVSKIGK